MMLTGLKNYEADFCYSLMVTFANVNLSDIERERCLRRAFEIYSDNAKLASLEPEKHNSENENEG